MKHVSQLSTNSRVIKDLLTSYKDTFSALCELLNNSIQAHATTIDLTLDYSSSLLLRKIVVKDNGNGVSSAEFEKKILEIGTDVKKGGQGIGRFGALQIGEKMTIETVGYDDHTKKYSITTFPLDASTVSSTLSNVNFEFETEILKNKVAPYYKVTIEKLHHNKQQKVPKKNKITESFLLPNINHAIFEKYPYQIFNRELAFRINGIEIDPNDFVVDSPRTKTESYIDLNGETHEFIFSFYQIQSDLNKVKVFLRVHNEGVYTVAFEYTYSSDWYSPELGTWFIYIDSLFFKSDLFRNIDMDDIGDEEIRKLKNFIKDTINTFFRAENKRFEKFINELENDIAYPSNLNLPSAETRKVLFQKIAYLIEDEYKLKSKDENLRSLFYSLIERAITSGHVEEILNHVNKLSDESLGKLQTLLQKTDLENVITFGSNVAIKLEFLDFLHQLTYGDISKVLLERSQLHKIIEKELWLFGEAYNGTSHLWSDRQIGAILEELSTKFFRYEATEDDENLIPFDVPGIHNITDLVFFNEKILDNEDREIMIVELKAPTCAIGKKELRQIDDYAFTVESYQGLPKDNVRYKFIIVSSKLTSFATSKMKSQFNTYGIPFLYDKKAEKNIEVYVYQWSEIIETNKRKLGYLSSKLQIREKNAQMKFEEEYSDIITDKVSARLVKNKAH